MGNRTFTPEQRERLLELLAKGKFLAEIAREPDMPDARTIYRWANAGDEFSEQIREAREVGAWLEAEATVAEIRKSDDPQKARVLLEARKWRLGHLSRTFAHKPVIGALVNVDGDDAFGAIREALDRAAAGISSRGDSTRAVVIEGEARSVDAPRGLANLAGAGGERMGQDPDGR